MKVEVKKINTVVGTVNFYPEVGDRLVVYNNTGEVVLRTSTIFELERKEDDDVIRIHTRNSVYDVYFNEER